MFIRSLLDVGCPHIDLFHVARQRHSVLVHGGVANGARTAAGSVIFGRRLGLLSPLPGQPNGGIYRGVLLVLALFITVFE